MVFVVVTGFCFAAQKLQITLIDLGALHLLPGVTVSGFILRSHIICDNQMVGLPVLLGAAVGVVLRCCMYSTNLSSSLVHSAELTAKSCQHRVVSSRLSSLVARIR